MLELVENVTVNGTLAQRVLLERRALNWNQDELASRAGVSRSYVSHIERAQIPNPTLDVIVALARALGVEPEYLLGWSDDAAGEDRPGNVAERGQSRVSEPLFVQRDGTGYNRTALRQLLIRTGERAGVMDCHPHRLRHTFAITCLRNGMNAYALQMALGHATMEMVRVYLEIAQADLDAAHRQASPVANWGL